MLCPPVFSFHCNYPASILSFKFLALSLPGRSGSKFLNALLCLLASEVAWPLLPRPEKMGDGMGGVEVPMSDVIFFKLK